MSEKLLILTNGNYFARLILDRLVKEHAENISGILIVTGDYKARSGLKALWEVGRHTAFPYLIYKLVTIFFFKIAQFVFAKSTLTVKSLAEKHSIPIASVVDINSNDGASWVSAHRTDLLVSVSCPQMIKTAILQQAQIASINIHSSLLPKYAGLAPYYWVLSNKEAITGTTVHYMTKKFDDGNVLVQKKINILEGESAFNLFCRLSILGSSALVEAVGIAIKGAGGVEQNFAESTYFSNPDLSSYKNLRKNGHRLVRVSELAAAIKRKF